MVAEVQNIVGRQAGHGCVLHRSSKRLFDVNRRRIVASARRYSGESPSRLVASARTAARQRLSLSRTSAGTGPEPNTTSMRPIWTSEVRAAPNRARCRASSGPPRRDGSRCEHDALPRDIDRNRRQDPRLCPSATRQRERQVGEQGRRCGGREGRRRAPAADRRYPRSWPSLLRSALILIVACADTIDSVA